MSDKETTHFGYKDVAKDAKAGMVADVFHSVAARYDLMNDLMSGGIHRIWKRFTIELSGVRKNNAVLDIAGGTGDLAARFAARGEAVKAIDEIAVEILRASPVLSRLVARLKVRIVKALYHLDTGAVEILR